MDGPAEVVRRWRLADGAAQDVAGFLLHQAAVLGGAHAQAALHPSSRFLMVMLAMESSVRATEARSSIDCITVKPVELIGNVGARRCTSGGGHVDALRQVRATGEQSNDYYSGSSDNNLMVNRSFNSIRSGSVPL